MTNASANFLAIVNRIGQIEVLHALRCVVFIAILLLSWISLRPFGDLGFQDQRHAQIVSSVDTYLAFGLLCTLAFAIIPVEARKALCTLLSPSWALFICWMTVNIMLAQDPSMSLKRFAFSFCVIATVSTLLHLPTSAAKFGQWLAAASLVLLLLCYAGVLVAPNLSIHQATDVSESQLAGDWRGVFGHKNGAAAMMAILIFIGIFLTQARLIVSGILVIVLSGMFLVFTGGKAASLLCIAVLLLVKTAFAARTKLLRAAILLMPLLILNLLSVGTVLSETLAQFARLLPLDTTFTGRGEIWEFSIASISKHPFNGYGFAGFWGGESLKNTNMVDVELDWTWTAATSHNGYLDSILNMGMPGFGFVILLLVLAPIKNIQTASEFGNDPSLTLLFARIWLFGIYLASMESFFFDGSNPIWVCFLVALTGVHYLSRYPTVLPSSPE